MRAIVVALVAAAALAAGAADARVAAAVNCGTLQAGGRTWHLLVVGVSCKTGRGVVRTLAGKPLPPRSLPRYPGTYTGMGCVGGAKNGRRVLECIDPNRKRMVIATAVTR